MKNIYAGLITVIFLLNGNISATTYYSQGSLPANILANWNNVRVGGGTVPSNFTTSGDSFVVQSGHSMTTSAAWALASGVKLTIDSSATLTATNLITPLGTFVLKNGGTYVHNTPGSTSNGTATDFPGSTRILGSTSTVEIQKWANGGTSPIALPGGISWGNLTINVASLAGSWNQTANISSITGNLLILSTGGTTKEFRLTGANTLNMNIAGNVTVSGGIINMTNGSGVPTMVIGGGLTVNTGGTFVGTSTSTSWTITMQGDMIINGGTFNWVQSSASSKAYNLKIGGNFSMTSGTFDCKTIGSGSYENVYFINGSPNVIFSQSGGTFTITKISNWIVSNGKTVTLTSPLTLPAGDTITVQDGGTLALDSAVTTSGGVYKINGTLRLSNSGALNGASAVYGASDSLVYAGTIARTCTNTEFPAAGGPGSVIINNPAGVTLHADRTIGKSLVLTSGNLFLNSSTLTIDSAASCTGGGTGSMVIATGSGSLRKKFIAPGTFTYAVGDTNGTPEYSPLTLTFNSGTFSSGYASVKLANMKHPNNSSVSAFLERYWTIGSSGITAFSADVKAKYVQADVMGTESNIYCGKWNGAAWSLHAAADVLNDTLSATSLSALGDFTGGESAVFGGAGVFSLKMIPEGYYDNVSGHLAMRDTFSVFLANINAPYSFVDSVKIILDSVTATASCPFQSAPAGTYYLVVKGRNIIETWSSAGGISYTPGTNANYDFTSSASKAFGSNQKLVGTKYCIYSGDTNTDGIVDYSDLSMVDNDSFNFAAGYLPSDVSGDGFVDYSDLSIVDNNSFSFVSVVHP